MKYLIYLLLVLFIFSCRTVKKNTHEQYNKTDSSNIIIKEESSVKTDNSIINKQKTEEAKANTVKIKLIYGIDSGKIQVVHIPTGFNNKEGINRIVDQLVNNRLKEVQIDIDDFSINRNTNTNINKDITDSSNRKEEKKVDVSKESGEKTGNKTTKGMSMAAIIWGVAIIAAILIFFLIGKYVPNIFNKKK